MDFELLSETPKKPPSVLDLLERLLTNRQRQWQIWGDRPPYVLALLILLTVTLEMTMSSRLFHNLGTGETVIPQFLQTVLLMVGFELLFATVVLKGALLVGKKGNFLTLMTYLNLSLTPLLFVLPVTLVCWLSGGPTASFLRFMILFSAGFKVLAYWKQAIEHVTKLTSVQSAVVMYMVMGLGVFVSVLFFYVGFIRTITQALSS